MDYGSSKVRESLEVFIDHIGQSTGGHFDAQPTVLPTEEDRRFIIDRFERQQNMDGKLIVLASVILVLIFSLGIFLVLHFLGDPKTMLLVLGGHFFSLLVIVVWLRKLWFEKSTFDALLTIVSGLNPAEASRILIDFHFRSLKLAAPQIATLHPSNL